MSAVQRAREGRGGAGRGGDEEIDTRLLGR